MKCGTLYPLFLAAPLAAGCPGLFCPSRHNRVRASFAPGALGFGFLSPSQNRSGAPSFATQARALVASYCLVAKGGIPKLSPSVLSRFAPAAREPTACGKVLFARLFAALKHRSSTRSAKSGASISKDQLLVHKRKKLCGSRSSDVTFPADKKAQANGERVLRKGRNVRFGE